MNIADLARRLDNLIRCGTIHAIRHAQPPRVRVASGGLVTDWLPWIVLRAGTTATWSPPTVGEQCVLFSPGGDPAAGLVLPALYADHRSAPADSPDVHVIEYPDGARITYDHAASSLTVAGVATVTVHAAESVTLDTPNTHCTGALTVDGLLTYTAGLSGRDGGGNSTAITGPFTHQDGELSSNGVVLHTHVHSDAGGSGNSGGPVV